MKSLILTCHMLLLLSFASNCAATEPMIRVLVWDEQQPAQKQAYENVLGNTIAARLSKQSGLRVISANINEPEKGLPTSLLESI